MVAITRMAASDDLTALLQKAIADTREYYSTREHYSTDDFLHRSTSITNPIVQKVLKERNKIMRRPTEFNNSRAIISEKSGILGSYTRMKIDRTYLILPEIQKGVNTGILFSEAKDKFYLFNIGHLFTPTKIPKPLDIEDEKIRPLLENLAELIPLYKREFKVNTYTKLTEIKEDSPLLVALGGLLDVMNPKRKLHYRDVEVVSLKKFGANILTYNFGLEEIPGFFDKLKGVLQEGSTDFVILYGTCLQQLKSYDPVYNKFYNRMCKKHHNTFYIGPRATLSSLPRYDMGSRAYISVDEEDRLTGELPELITRIGTLQGPIPEENEEARSIQEGLNDLIPLLEVATAKGNIEQVDILHKVGVGADLRVLYGRKVSFPPMRITPANLKSLVRNVPFVNNGRRSNAEPPVNNGSRLITGPPVNNGSGTGIIVKPSRFRQKVPVSAERTIRPAVQGSLPPSSGSSLSLEPIPERVATASASPPYALDETPSPLPSNGAISSSVVLRPTTTGVYTPTASSAIEASLRESEGPREFISEADPREALLQARRKGLAPVGLRLGLEGFKSPALSRFKKSRKVEGGRRRTRRRIRRSKTRKVRR